MFPAFVRNIGTLASSASLTVASAVGLPMMPPMETTFSCWVSRLKPSTAAVVFVDWSSATTRLSLRPCPRPFTPPDRLISFTARAIPARAWTPQGTKLEALGVSGTSAPILIGPPCAAPLDPPGAVAPPAATTSAPRAPRVAINKNRFTTFLLPSRMSRD